MRSLVPVPIAPPPLSRRVRIVLLLLLPLWLPIFAVGVAVFVVVWLLFAPDPPTDLEQAPDDDGLPDDYVPPFVPPRRKRPAKALPPPRRISVIPAPASVTSTTSRPAEADELSQTSASSWSGRFPGG